MASFTSAADLPSVVNRTRSFSSMCWYQDRKSTRLNSSHGYISYAVFCLKKKKTENTNVLTDAEANIRKNFLADVVTYCLPVKPVQTLSLVVCIRCQLLKAHV